MRKTMILAATAVFAMISCTREQVTNDKKTIVLGSTVVTSVESRGPVNSNYTTFNAGIVAYTGSATVTAPTFTQDPITFTNGATTTVTGQFYPLDGSAVKFVGYAPAGASVSTGSATFTITGDEDVMYAPEVSGTKSSTVPNLVFKHKLTQLQFQIVAEDAAAITAWGNVTKIEVTGVPNGIVMNLADGMVTATGTANFTGFTGTQTLTTTLAGVGTGTMIYPISAANVDLKVYTANAATGQTVTLAVQTFEEGKAYKINLTFKATAILLTATVTDWVEVVTPVEQDIF